MSDMTTTTSKTTLDDLHATSRSRAVAANPNVDETDETVVTATIIGTGTCTGADTDTVVGTGAADTTTVAATGLTAALATSQEIRDRGSTFVGYVYRARTTEEARGVVGWHGRRQLDLSMARVRDRHRRHANEKDKDKDEAPTPYTIAAWRCMVVKPGRTGLGGPDEFQVEGGSDDGGERYAGKKVLGAMQREGVIDAVVIVSRWFGGTLLGPVRFTHVDTCASEVCRKFIKVEEMEECVQTLTRLDDVLATLRTKWATTPKRANTADPSSSRSAPDNSRARSKAADYRIMQRDLDLTKVKRLIHARECAIQNTKILIEKYKTSI